jgi:hypothetical protein
MSTATTTYVGSNKTVNEIIYERDKKGRVIGYEKYVDDDLAYYGEAEETSKECIEIIEYTEYDREYGSEIAYYENYILVATEVYNKDGDLLSESKFDRYGHTIEEHHYSLSYDEDTNKLKFQRSQSIYREYEKRSLF